MGNAIWGSLVAVPPHWSTHAIIAGVLTGFVLGALTIGLYALRLQQAELLAGSGGLEERDA